MSVVKTKIRDSRIEWIKLLAILGIVFYHTVTTPDLHTVTFLMNGAVPAFTMLSVYFSTRIGLNKPDAWKWIAKRSLKLYGLFLIWNLFYLTVRLFAMRGGVESSFPGIHPDPLFLSGYANAIWFLNFVLISNMIAVAVGKIASHLNVPRRAWLTSLLFALCLLLGLSRQFALLEPDIQFFYIIRKAIPSLLLGLCIGVAFAAEISSVPRRLGIAGISFLLLVASCIYLTMDKKTTFLAETLVGLFSIMFFLTAFKPGSLPLLNPNLSLWLFVAHPLFLHATRKICPVLGLNWDEGGAMVQAPACLIIVGLLFLVYYLFRYIKPASWLLLEKAENVRSFSERTPA